MTTTRSTDNRDLSEMEQFYLARIQALQAALLEANKTADALRSDVAYLEQQLTRILGKEAC